MKKIAKIFLFMLLAICIIGCENKTDKITNNINEKRTYNKNIDNTSINLSIPSNWHYEELSLEDNYKLALKIYKESQEESITLYYYNDPVGFCGTGRDTSEIKLGNGQIAILGYELGNEYWSDITFPTINPRIVLINDGINENEALEIINTIDLKNIS